MSTRLFVSDDKENWKKKICVCLLWARSSNLQITNLSNKDAILYYLFFRYIILIHTELVLLRWKYLTYALMLKTSSNTSRRFITIREDTINTITVTIAG